MNKLNYFPVATFARTDILSFCYNVFYFIVFFGTGAINANHPSSHGHHHGSHHHPYSSHHHQPVLLPPSSSSASIRDTYVHKYSYKLPGTGSYFKMNRVYARPYLPSFVGSEQFRSTPPEYSFEDQRALHQLQSHKDNALLSSLSFLPDADASGDLDDQQNNNNTSGYHNPRYDPFNPRYAVGRVEVTDEEWEAEMREDFESSGLLHGRGKRGIMSKVPKGLVNLNFGTHTCVHMGTELKSSESAYAPTALSYPIKSVDTNALHTIVMVDLDHESTKGQNEFGISDNDLKSSHMYLHWMVINIPGAKVDQGQTITSYKAPAPEPGSGIHRYVIVAYEQKSENPMRIDHEHAPFRTTFPCQESGRFNFDLENFRAKYNLSEHPIAANYFQVQYDEFVENIDQSCSIEEKEEIIEDLTPETVAFHALPILNSRFL